MADEEANNVSSYETIKGTEISYSRKDELGSGSFGTVHLGIFKEKKVAIKKILKKFQSVKEDREVKNQLEAQGHENVVQIFETVQDLDFRYIVMELCAKTLWDVIETTEKPYEGPPLPTDKQVMYQIADGLDYIHSQNVIHHDIKPENILISVTGQMKLSDFGLSKQSSKRDTCSWSGSRGTPLWMAPEMRRTDGTTKRRSSASMSDIFPCGCVFFVFLTRENDWIHPFGDKKDPNKVILNIKKGKPINIKELNPDHFAFSFILEMIDRNPLKRISAKDVKKILKFSISIEALFVRTNCSTGKLSSNLIEGPFKGKENSLKKMGIYDARCGSFHPTEPIFACGLYYGQVLILEYFDSTKDCGYECIPPKIGGAEGFKVFIKWNMDGTKLAAASYKGAINIWSYPGCDLLVKHTTTFQWPIISWNPFNSNAFAVYESGYGKIMISCSSSQTPPIELKSSFVDSWFCCLDWISENQLACGYKNGSIEIHELNYSEGTSQRLDKNFKHYGEVRSIIWNEGSKQLASCLENGCIQIWSWDNSETPVYSLSDGLKYCRSLAWHPIGKCGDGGTDATRTVPGKTWIACGLSSGDIVVWSPLEEQNQIQPQRLGRHSAPVLQVLFSPNGQFLASNGYKGEVIVWFTEDWQEICTLPGDFWINSWNATSCKLVISDQMSQSGKKDVKVIEIGTYGKSEISAGRGRKRKNSE